MLEQSWPDLFGDKYNSSGCGCLTVAICDRRKIYGHMPGYRWWDEHPERYTLSAVFEQEVWKDDLCSLSAVFEQEVWKDDLCT